MSAIEIEGDCALYGEPKVRQLLEAATRIAEEHHGKPKACDFANIDHLHYLGTDSLHEFMNQAEYTKENNDLKDCPTSTRKHVLDIGSGVGGPARFLATNFDVKVVGVEYRDAFCRIARTINKFCEIPENDIEVFSGDFLAFDFEAHGVTEKFDRLVSQLCFMYIVDKGALLRKCSESLKPGAKFIVEDFFVRSPFSAEDEKTLNEEVGVPRGSLLTKEKYIAKFEENGLVVDEWADETFTWTEFCWTRFNNFLSQKDHLLNEHGKEFTDELTRFYGAVATLFRNKQTSEETKDLFERNPNVKRTLRQLEIRISSPQALGGVRVIGHKK